jgi:hypothetical protein
MSLLTKHAALAAALSTVDGVTGYQRMPSAPKVGDAWVLMGRGDRGDNAADAFTVAWRARLCVPTNDEVAALELFSGLWEPLYYALGAAGAQVDAFVPVVIPTKAGDIWAYELVCRTGD